MSPLGVKSRTINKEFHKHFFKPRGIPLVDLEILQIGHDELEAIRLVDVEHMKQQDAAVKMNISSSTIQRIIESAREKIGKALINGYAMEIEGGNYSVAKQCRKHRKCRCSLENKF